MYSNIGNATTNLNKPVTISAVINDGKRLLKSGSSYSNNICNQLTHRYYNLIKKQKHTLWYLVIVTIHFENTKSEQKNSLCWKKVYGIGKITNSLGGFLQANVPANVTIWGL